MKGRRKHNTFQRVGQFDLSISKKHTRVLDGKNLGVLGAYDDPESGMCMFTARNGAELIRLSKTCGLRSVWVFTAKNAEGLPDPDWERAKRDALFVIAGAKRRGDEPFLHEVVNHMRRTGEKRGRPTDMKARRRRVEELERLLSGKPSLLLRELAENEAAERRSFLLTKSGQQTGADARSLKSTEEGRRAIAGAVRFHESIKAKRSKVESRNRSLSARVSELCWDTYQIWVLFGEPPVDQSLPKAVIGEFEKLGFRLPRQLKLLSHAIEIGRQRFPS